MIWIRAGGRQRQRGGKDMWGYRESGGKTNRGRRLCRVGSAKLDEYVVLKHEEKERKD
jgi:hypothetical protein